MQANRSEVANRVAQRWKLILDERRMWRTSKRIGKLPAGYRGNVYSETLLGPEAIFSVNADDSTNVAELCTSYIHIPKDYWLTISGLGEIGSPLCHVRHLNAYHPLIPLLEADPNLSLVRETEDLITLSAKFQSATIQATLHTAKSFFPVRLHYRREQDGRMVQSMDYRVIESREIAPNVHFPTQFESRNFRASHKHRLPSNLRFVDGRIVGTTKNIGSDSIPKPESRTRAVVEIVNASVDSIAAEDLRLISERPDGLKVSMQDDLSKQYEWQGGEVLEVVSNEPAAREDASEQLELAVARAQIEDKRILLQVGGPGCPPCVKLSKLLEEKWSILGQEYVLAKLDSQMENFDNVVTPLRTNGQRGLPWMAVLSTEGNVLATSDRNIGFPITDDNRSYFREMLARTSRRLGRADFDEVMSGFEDSASKAPAVTRRAWSQEVHGLAGRLKVEARTLKKASYYSVWVELMNASTEGISILDRPTQVRCRVFNSANEIVEPLRNSLPFSGPVRLAESVTIPSGDYLGTRIDDRTTGILSMERRAQVSLARRQWSLSTDENYSIEVDVTFSGDSTHWNGTLKLPRIGLPKVTDTREADAHPP